jgi:hypothetical protein
MIPYDTPGAFRIQDQIEFQLLMIMKREREFFFYPGKDRETIALRKRGDLPDDIRACAHMAAIWSLRRIAYWKR